MPSRPSYSSVVASTEQASVPINEILESSTPYAIIFITSTPWDERSRAMGLILGAALFRFRPLEPLTLRVEIEACPGERTES